MERGQSLAAAPLFDGRNCAYWKRRMCDFLYSIDDSIWTFVEEGWIVSDKPNAKWDKATKDKFNAKNKAVNAIFCGVGHPTDNVKRYQRSRRHKASNAYDSL